MQQPFARMVLVGLTAGLSVAACANLGDGALNRDDLGLCTGGLLGQALNSTGKVPEGCTRIEGGDIGQAPQTLAFGAITLTITRWVDKDGEPGEKVGFSFSATGPVTYAVKAGKRTFASTSTSWTHPAGTSGSEASGISNVTFCPGDKPDAGRPDAGSSSDAGITEGPKDAGTSAPDGGDGVVECGPGTIGTPHDAGSGCRVDADCGPNFRCNNAVCDPVVN